MNIHPTHNFRFFDKNNPEHLKEKAEIEEKAKTSDFWAKVLEVWTVRDVEKRETAEKNNLNYKVFWRTDLSDFYEWLEQYK